MSITKNTEKDGWLHDLEQALKLLEKNYFQENKKILQYVKRDCCYYYSDSDNIKDYCCAEWTEDKKCIFVQKKIEYSNPSLNHIRFLFPRCAYFEKAVLPTLDIDIQDRYWKQRQGQMIAVEELKHDDEQKKEKALSLLKEKMKTKRVVCQKCGKEIVKAKSNRQKYCNICKRKIKKQQAKKRKKRQRENGSDVTRQTPLKPA